MLQKIKFINDELKSEVFDALEEHGMNQINLPQYQQQIQYASNELDNKENASDFNQENKEN